MKYIIRTIEEGQRVPLDRIQEKRKAVYDRIMAAGMHYLESECILGSLNAMGQRIEEHVYVIEPMAGIAYV
jgi:hypothetical protein